jgi:hypothetical protein
MQEEESHVTVDSWQLTVLEVHQDAPLRCAIGSWEENNRKLRVEHQPLSMLRC